jgi:RimJ/RimL family protein N-acetyltransferase
MGYLLRGGKARGRTAAIIVQQAMVYWLAKPYWGRGIMTAVVGRLCDYAFDNFGLVKITAHVFTSNPASGRILEKCGFQLEGVLKKHFEKDGHYLDSNLYGLLK